MNIYEKLLCVQSSLKAPKNLFNNFAKFNYRSLESICEALKPILSEHKLSLTIGDSTSMIGERYYVTAKATLINIEDPAEQIIETASAREAATKKGMDDSQITGSTSSYARKYCLNGLFLIDDSEDTDHIENPKNLKDQNLMTSGQSDLLKSLCKKENLKVAEICKEYGITKTMKADSFDCVFKIIKTHIKSGDIGFDLTKGIKT